MASIRQYRRRAIESLRSAAHRLGANLPPFLSPLPQDLGDRAWYLDKGARLYPWGVSLGYGTCAGIPGMDVLVLGREPGACRPQDVQGRRCEFAVLVDAGPEPTERTVQLLKPVKSRIARPSTSPPSPEHREPRHTL